MICHKCGKKNNDEATFCKYCGEKLDSAADDEAAESPAETKRKKKFKFKRRGSFSHFVSEAAQFIISVLTIIILIGGALIIYFSPKGNVNQATEQNQPQAEPQAAGLNI